MTYEGTSSLKLTKNGRGEGVGAEDPSMVFVFFNRALQEQRFHLTTRGQCCPLSVRCDRVGLKPRLAGLSLGLSKQISSWRGMGPIGAVPELPGGRSCVSTCGAAKQHPGGRAAGQDLDTSGSQAKDRVIRDPLKKGTSLEQPGGVSCPQIGRLCCLGARNEPIVVCRTIIPALWRYRQAVSSSMSSAT